MLYSNKSIAIRISVTDGDKVRKELTLTGETGKKALEKIKEATKPASKSLSAINVVAEQAHYGMLNLAGGAGTLGLNLARLGPVGMAAAVSIGGFIKMVSSGLKELKEAEEAMNHLQAALRATDFASGVTTREIEALGEALERTTLFKKEEIEKAAANLTSFGNIQNEVFTRALRLATDLAVRLGTDVPSAADMLGHALEKPEEGLGRLARKVSDLSFAQKESIANFIKQGDVASAQAVIFEHLESKINGLAEAQTKGMAGSINRLSNAWGNFLERLGKTEFAQGSVNALTYTIKGLSDAIDPNLTDKAAKLEEQIKLLENRNATRLFNDFGGKSPLLARKKEELAQIKAELAAQEAADAAEKAHAMHMAKKAADVRRSDHMMELAQKYTKEREGGWSGDQKALSEYAQRRKEILALSQGHKDKHMEQALSALDISTGSKLKGVNKGDSSATFDAAKKDLDAWKENVLKNLGEAGAANSDFAAKVDDIYRSRLKEAYTQSLADGTSWSDGMALAFQRYSDEATNSAKIAEQVFNKAAHGIEDALMNVVKSGEFNLKNLSNIIEKVGDEIMELVIRQAVIKPIVAGITGGLGGLFGGIFHEGGVVGQTPVPLRIVSPDLFTNAPRFHKGLAADEFPAILQRGEVVIPKNKVHSYSEETKQGDININFHITTPSPQAFLASRGQIMATLAGEMNRYALRNR